MKNLLRRAGVAGGLFLASMVGLTHYFVVAPIENATPVVDQEQVETSYRCVDGSGVEITSRVTLDGTISACGTVAAENGSTLYVEQVDTSSTVTRTQTHEVRGSTEIRVSEADAQFITVSGPIGGAVSNNAPAWDAIPSPSFSESTSASYCFITENDLSDADGDTLAISLNASSTALPTGVTVNDSTDCLDYDGLGSAGNTAGVIIDASDGFATVASSAFTLAINASGSGWTVENLTAGSIDVETSFTISNLTGEDFGATGPSVVLYDNYSSGSTGSQHSSTPTYSATSTTWEANGNVLVDDSRYSRGRGVELIDANGNSNASRFKWATYPDADAEFFITGSFFYPTGQEGEGNSKVIWMGGDNPSGDNWYQGNNEPDLVMVSRINGGASRFIISNDSAAGRSSWDTTNWPTPANDLMRFSYYLSGTTSSSTTTGRAIHFTETAGILTRDYSNYKALFVAEDDPQGFNRFNFSGYFGSGINAGDQLINGDIYLAVGAGAPARVELTNNATYLSSTHVSPCVPTSWSQTSITATCYEIPSTPYLHVHDATDTHTNGGTGRQLSAL